MKHRFCGKTLLSENQHIQYLFIILFLSMYFLYYEFGLYSIYVHWKISLDVYHILNTWISM